MLVTPRIWQDRGVIFCPKKTPWQEHFPGARTDM